MPLHYIPSTRVNMLAIREFLKCFSVRCFKQCNARSARSLVALAVWSRQDTAALDVYTLPRRVSADSCSGALHDLLLASTPDDSPACTCFDVSGSGFCLADLGSLSSWIRLRSGALRPHIAARMSRSSPARHRPFWLTRGHVLLLSRLLPPSAVRDKYAPRPPRLPLLRFGASDGGTITRVSMLSLEGSSLAAHLHRPLFGARPARKLTTIPSHAPSHTARAARHGASRYL